MLCCPYQDVKQREKEGQLKKDSKQCAFSFLCSEQNIHLKFGPAFAVVRHQIPISAMGLPDFFNISKTDDQESVFSSFAYSSTSFS